MPSVKRMIHAEKAAPSGARAPSPEPSPRWPLDAVLALFELPFTALVHRAQQVHREHHVPDAVQLSTLLSIKTGGCPEDCGYCPQAKRYHTGVADEALVDVETVVAAAEKAKAAGATR